MSTVKRTMEAKRTGAKANVRRYQPENSGGKPITYKDVDMMYLIELMMAVESVGGAIRLGTTRDGGAFAIGVYGDGPDVYNVYANSVEKLHEHFENLTAIFSTLTPD